VPENHHCLSDADCSRYAAREAAIRSDFAELKIMTLVEVNEEIGAHCEEIAKLFRPGAKVSVIVRNPNFDKTPHSAAALTTIDDIDELIGCLKYLKTRDKI
jgi:hypothetical protein